MYLHRYRQMYLVPTDSFKQKILRILCGFETCLSMTFVFLDKCWKIFYQEMSGRLDDLLPHFERFFNSKKSL